MRSSTLKAAKNRLQGLAHSVQFNGNIPIPSSNGTGLCSANGGIVPPVLVEEDRVPKFYQDAIAFCGAVSPSQLPNTALVYNLMVTSQLPRDVLGNIWSLVNRSLPGQLTRQEFFSCLALIALAQRGQSLSALCDVTTLPIPYFQTFKANEKPNKSSSSVHNPKQKAESNGPSMSTKAGPVQDSKNNLVNGTSSTTSSSHNKQSNKAAFIPTHLIEEGPSSKMSPEQDLLGLFSSNSSTADGPSTSSTNFSATNNDLTEIAELFEFRSASVEMVVSKNVEESLTIQLDSGLHDSRENGISHSSESTPSEQLDPYAALRFTDDTPVLSENECIDSWRQVVDQSFQVISDALGLLSRSPELTSEILETDKGFNFVESVHAVYHIVGRIKVSLKTRRISDQDLSSKCEEVHTLWEKFLQSDAGRKFWDATMRPVSSHGESGALQHRCGICLQSLAEERLRIEFVGRFYHSSCANFWINRINTLLPKLE
uniref:EH domain-containing protein n=1 Tax=Acrobeloides nanus TaxID=290746 RepID=A0A914C4V1_9BILA